AAVQVVTNLLDSPGAMQRYDEPPRPREIIAAAHRRGIGVMGIRAVQAGALTDALIGRYQRTTRRGGTTSAVPLSVPWRASLTSRPRPWRIATRCPWRESPPLS